jgi:hypothetical protein
MEELEIKSARSGTRLRLFDMQDEHLWASMSNSEFSGTIQIYMYRGLEDLVALFESMAENWRGWIGKKSWSSFEGEFVLGCMHDKLGHIAMEVEMWHGRGRWEPWYLKASLVVDAGQLEAIARDAREFLRA